MVARLGDRLDEEIPQGAAGLSLGLPGPQDWLLFPWPLPSQALLERGWGAVFLFRLLPCNAKSLGPAHSAPKQSNQLSERKGACGRGSRRCQKQPPPAQQAQRSLWGSGCCRQTLGQTDSWTLGLAMRLSGGQSSLLTALLPLLTCLHLGMSLGE